jgi:(1->4)-alpha-D-glucan 1-alpha-D-glucosylmutase
MRIPNATYRLQLNHQFTFADVEQMVPYLNDLGISDLYLSPILQAQPGSTHGYDTIDYQVINQSFGGEVGFKHFTKK